MSGRTGCDLIGWCLRCLREHKQGIMVEASNVKVPGICFMWRWLKSALNFKFGYVKLSQYESTATNRLWLCHFMLWWLWFKLLEKQNSKQKAESQSSPTSNYTQQNPYEQHKHIFQQNCCVDLSLKKSRQDKAADQLWLLLMSVPNTLNPQHITL